MTTASVKIFNGSYRLRAALCALFLILLNTDAAAKHRFDSLTADQGIPQNTIHAILQTRDGRLWFPTQGGVVVIDPNAVPLNTQPPPVVIEDCLLDHKSVDYRRQISIAADKQNVEIRYAGLSFVKPEQVRFKYKLEGLDDDWEDAGTRRT